MIINYRLSCKMPTISNESVESYVLDTFSIFKSTNWPNKNYLLIIFSLFLVNTLYWVSLWHFHNILLIGRLFSPSCWSYLVCVFLSQSAMPFLLPCLMYSVILYPTFKKHFSPLMVSFLVLWPMAKHLFTCKFIYTT